MSVAGQKPNPKTPIVQTRAERFFAVYDRIVARLKAEGKLPQTKGEATHAAD